MRLLVFISVLSSALIGNLHCQNTQATTGIDTTVTSPGPIDECFSSNTTCEECLSNPKCFYCDADKQCKTFVKGVIFPDNCEPSKARWMNCSFCCSLDLQALMIAASVVAAVIFLIFLCCICYCCNKTCKALSDRKMRSIEKKISKKREQLRQRIEDRKAERQARNDAIRIKYGLKPATYTQFENAN